MYHFQPLTERTLSMGTGRLAIPETMKWQELQLGIYAALFRGALLRLFGEPTASSSVADEAYKYVFEARDDEGNTWILTAYEGPSGPAIGGNARDRTIYPAAVALLELIEATAPADFVATIYDDDTDNTVTYGCKDGTCFANEKHGRHL